MVDVVNCDCSVIIIFKKVRFYDAIPSIAIHTVTLTTDLELSFISSFPGLSAPDIGNSVCLLTLKNEHDIRLSCEFFQ